jgi:hypothetical protein
MLLALVQADTHVLALELIVFVNDRQDATHPASAAVPAGRRQIRSQACCTRTKGALQDHCCRPCHRMNGLGINTNGAERSNVIGSRGWARGHEITGVLAPIDFGSD